MLRRRWALLVVVALVTAVAPACNRGSSTAKRPPVERVEEIPVVVTVRIDGDLRGSVENATVRTQLVVRDTDDPAVSSTTIFGVETLDPIQVGDVAFTAGFAVRPYRGPGKYTIREGSVYDPQQDENNRSSIKVLFWPEGLAKDAYDYLRREKPCRVEIRDGGSEGSINCPRVTNEVRDKHFSLDMQWRFVPGGATTTTAPPTSTATP